MDAVVFPGLDLSLAALSYFSNRKNLQIKAVTCAKSSGFFFFSSAEGVKCMGWWSSQDHFHFRDALQVLQMPVLPVAHMCRFLCIRSIRQGSGYVSYSSFWWCPACAIGTGFADSLLVAFVSSQWSSSSQALQEQAFSRESTHISTSYVLLKKKKIIRSKFGIQFNLILGFYASAFTPEVFAWDQRASFLWFFCSRITKQGNCNH